MKKTLRTVFSAALFTVLMAATPIQPPLAHAAVTQSDLNDQRLVVMEELIDVLHEHVTLLQLAMINKLENQVAYLQAVAETQK